MDALKQLQQLVTPPTGTITGIITAAHDNMVSVATAQGLIQVRSTSPVRVGDQVRIQSGQIIEIRPTQSSERYYL
ncbi:hypothetical protein [Chitinibacter sp. GC72]|uniref:hypothetical protein n=1 Tax=Chitinibacter sp. GC72 TaxID=1526917 RepID=UPI0012FC88A4|nr:hypothetical protein [Chitinibacter sp. GC72]